jgi:homoserine O-acetyltransferase
MFQRFLSPEPFQLECGAILPHLEIGYHTFGSYTPNRNNVVWICHALTANSDASDWWNGLVGDNKFFNPNDWFIVCANIIGSCYGTTGAATINPDTGKRYGSGFPLITIRDMVAAHELLRSELGIEKIHLVIGGSLGGQQTLEWAVMCPNRIESIVVLATNARHSPWGIAFNSAQRIALEADSSLWDDTPNAGAPGLRAARSIAMLSYRNYPTFSATQSDAGISLEYYRAESYLRYQAEKLVRRFDAQAYWTLTKAMDSHNLTRGHTAIEDVLTSITARSLIIGISSDILFPVEEQLFLAAHIPTAVYREISSPFGHDGFLIEFKQLQTILEHFLQNNGDI